MKTLEAAKAVKSIGLFLGDDWMGAETDDPRFQEEVALFMNLCDHDWFSPGFIAFFIDRNPYDTEQVLKCNPQRFIPTSNKWYNTHVLYTLNTKFEQFSKEEKSLR